MYFENMTIGTYGDIELSKAEMDRIYEFAKHKWILEASSTKDIINPWITYTSEQLYERLEEIWNDRKRSEDDERWLNDLIIQAIVLTLSMRHERFNKDGK